jgi:hypothetical protein
MLMPNARRLARVTVVAAATVFALAACAPTAHPHSLHPQHSATQPTSKTSLSPSASASAKPVAVAAPKIRVPLTCNQVAPAGQLASTLSKPVTLDNNLQAIDDPWLPSDLEPYAWVQDGALVCDFGTNSEDSISYRANIMPDATQALWAPYFAQQTAPSSFNITPSPYGPNSNLNCESIYNYAECDLDVLVGTTWIDLQGYTDVPSDLTVAQAGAKFEPLFTTTVNAVKNADISEPAWTDPAATTVSVSSDYTSLDAALSAAIGLQVSTQEYEYGPTISEPTDDLYIPVHFDYFQDDTTAAEINIKVLPQGAWAWSAITAAAASEPNYATVTGIGDKAISYSITGQQNPLESVVEVIKGHNLFSVEVDTTPPAATPSVLTLAKEAAAVVAAKIG